MKRVLLSCMAIAAGATIAMAQEEPVFPTTLDYTLNGEKELPGVEVKIDDDGYGGFNMSITGESDAKEITITFAVPEGWDGWIISAPWGEVSDQPIAKTRGEYDWAPLENFTQWLGYQIGNSVTFAVEDEENDASLGLYKGDQAYQASNVRIEYNVVPEGGSSVVDGPAFPESLVVDTFPEEGLEVWQGEDWGVLTVRLTGEIAAETFDVVLDVPEGWDGFISMPYDDNIIIKENTLGPRKTRAEEPVWYTIDEVLSWGCVKGNRFTFKPNGEEQDVAVYLYKDGMVDMANYISLENNEVTTTYDPFPKTFDVTLSSPGLSMTQGMNEIFEVYMINVEGKSQEKDVTITLAVPEGWDGFVYMSDVDSNTDIDPLSTRAQEPEWYPLDFMLEFGFKEGNSMTVPADGEHVGQFYLYKNGMVDGANQIEVDFNVEYDYEKVNQAAYDALMVKIDVLQAEYNASLDALKKKYPDYDFSEWEYIIGENLDQAKTGALQALNSANEDGDDFFFPFDGEEIQAMIAEMNVRVPLTNANQAAYDKVIAQLDAAQEEYDAALEALKEKCPYYDFAEWEEIIGGALDQAKTGAKQALDSANEDGEEFFYPIDDEEFEAMIAEMTKDAENAPKFPESLDVTLSDNEGVKVSQGVEQGVYTISVSGQSDKKELTVTVAVPEGWDGFIGMSDVDGSDNQAAPSKVAPAEWVSVDEMVAYGMKKGNTMTFPVDGVEHSGQYYLYKGDVLDLANQIAIEFDVQSPLTAANKAAYDAVIAKIDALRNEYEAALAAVKEKYPDYDFSEWEEIISKALAESASGAEQALKAANEDGTEFNFAFDGEDIKGMIAEMEASPALIYANQAAYDAVIAKIDELQKEYEAALAAVTEKYPDYDLTEWKEIIGKALEEATSGAGQALKAANEEGEEFNFAFDGEDIKGMIAEMEANAALTTANQAAYDEVIAKVDELRKEYEDAVAEIKETNPDFDFTEWEEIGTLLEDMKGWAAQALASANEEGEEFDFAFDGEDIENMIEMMKVAAEGSGVAGVAVDDNASYYDLNGHKINRPQAGMYIKVVDGKSSKVVIK